MWASDPQKFLKACGTPYPREIPASGPPVYLLSLLSGHSGKLGCLRYHIEITMRLSPAWYQVSIEVNEGIASLFADQVHSF